MISLLQSVAPAPAYAGAPHFETDYPFSDVTEMFDTDCLAEFHGVHSISTITSLLSQSRFKNAPSKAHAARKANTKPRARQPLDLYCPAPSVRHQPNHRPATTRATTTRCKAVTSSIANTYGYGGSGNRIAGRTGFCWSNLACWRGGICWPSGPLLAKPGFAGQTGLQAKPGLQAKRDCRPNQVLLAIPGLLVLKTNSRPRTQDEVGVDRTWIRHSFKMNEPECGLI